MNQVAQFSFCLHKKKLNRQRETKPPPFRSVSKNVIQRFTIINTNILLCFAPHNVIITQFCVLFIHIVLFSAVANQHCACWWGRRVVSLVQSVYKAVLRAKRLSMYKEVYVAFGSVRMELFSCEVLKFLVLVHSIRFRRTVTVTTTTI